MVGLNHVLRGALMLGALVLVAGCGTTSPSPSSTGQGAVVGHYKLGAPYRIKGRLYRPEYDPAYSRVGVASWYGAAFHGLPTANGEVFDKEQITAAHPTLPLPSLVRVTNLENGRTIDVRVNDRGPFIGDRVIDLSQAAARQLGYESQGLARVKVEFLALAEDARGTPPAPTVARAPRPTTPAPPAQIAIPADREVQVAALAVQPAAAPRTCLPVGPQLVQIGAFAETDQASAAMAEVDGLGPVQVQPAFIGQRAVVRIRIGPVPDPGAAERVLREAVALGYTDAFLVPVVGQTRAAIISC
jgi:rare lipoprotein A